MMKKKFIKWNKYMTLKSVYSGGDGEEIPFDKLIR